MRHSHQELRAIARKTLRALELTPPLEDVDALAARLAERRGKPIILVATTELPPNVAFGVTGGDDNVDIVLYESRTSTTSQLLIILHELAHIILEHPRAAVDHSFRTGHQEEEYEMFSADVLAELIGPEPEAKSPQPPETDAHGEDGGAGRPWRWPWKRPDGPRTAIPTQSLYAADIEWEAETMATILLTWIPGYGGYVPPRQGTPLEQVLGDDGAW